VEIKFAWEVLKIQFILNTKAWVPHRKLFLPCDAPSHSLKNSNVNLKVETTKKRVVVRSLTCSLLGVKGHAGASGWRLGRMTSESIIHMDLHKLNNKLVNAWLEHFWCMDELRAYMDSQDSPQPELGENHHLPFYSIIYD
jgi:hypothetical protein